MFHTRIHALFTAALLGGFFLAGCGAPQSAQDASASSSQSPLPYACKSGEAVQAAYPDRNTAIVTYKGETHDMKLQVSADGARYIADGLEWWTKGSGPGSYGTFFVHKDDGTSGPAVDVCTQQ